MAGKLSRSRKRFMKLKYPLFGLMLMTAAACNNDHAGDTNKDSANTLHDTFPASHPADTTRLDSNSPDATKVDSGNRSTH